MLDSDLIDETEATEREGVVRLVRKFGGFTSDAVLDPHMERFTVEGIEGFISFLPDPKCVVVFGDPICAKEYRGALAEAFDGYLKARGKEVIYIGASEAFSKWAIGRVSKLMLEFGEELAFNPQIDPRKMTGTHAQLVRRKVKRALKEGVVIQEFILGDTALQNQIEKVGKLWLESRHGTQVHISGIYQFEDCFGKRWFYARKEDKVIGVITANVIEAEEGYLINHLMVPPGAPRGTSELLMVSALEILGKEGCCFTTAGAVNAKDLTTIIGWNRAITWFARRVFKMICKVVKINGLDVFWSKFSPQMRNPVFLLFSRKWLGRREITSLMNALSGKE